MFNQKLKKVIITIYGLLILSIVSVIIFLSINDSSTSETIKIGTSPDYPPLEYKENGKLKGFDIDLVKELAKEANIKVEIKEINFDNLITSIQNNKVDMIASGFSKNEEREKVVNFSTPYIESGNVIITNDGNVENINSIKDKKIGVLTGSTQEEVLKKQKFSNIKNFEDAQVALKSLQSGNIDAVYTDELNGRNISNKIKDINVSNDKSTSKEPMAYAISKTNKQLKTKIDTAIKKLNENKTYEKLSKKWFGTNIYSGSKLFK